MNVKLEKILVLLAIASIFGISANSLSKLSDPITMEEAIEISKNSELVKEGLANSYSFQVGTRYYNSSMVEQLKLWHRENYEKVPEGHSVWQVTYSFRRVKWLTEGPTVIVIIDAESGIITDEEWGVYVG